MTISLNTLSGITFLTESWAGPTTTYPVATPFVIEDGGTQNDKTVVGGGVILTHIFARCPPAGRPTANIYWTQTI